MGNFGGESQAYIVKRTINTVRGATIYLHFVTHVATRGYPH